jgi:hypothetical protein
MSEPPNITYRLHGGTEESVPMIPQEEVNAFYSVAGYAINQWAHLDRHLFQCFRVALATSDQKAAILYYRQKEFGSRLALTDDLLSATLSAPMLKKWKAIKGSLNTRIRNILAHHPIDVQTTITNVSPESPDNPIRVEHVIRAQFDESELVAGKERKQQTLRYNDLVQYVTKIQKWEQELRSFKDELEQQFCG